MSDLLPEALSSLFAAVAQPGPDSIARRFELGRRLLEQHPEKSLRVLERASGRRLSKAYLHRCIATFRLGTSFPFLLHSRLKVSHLDAVERLPRPSQGRLLREAERYGWSVRQQRQRALEARGTGPTASLVASTKRTVRQLRESLSTLAEEEPANRSAQRAELTEIHRALEEVLGLSQMLMARDAGASQSVPVPKVEASNTERLRVLRAANPCADVPRSKIERESVHYLGV